jgi:vacuolar-type H+-ATPase subunit B/Vma2
MVGDKVLAAIPISSLKIGLTLDGDGQFLDGDGLVEKGVVVQVDGVAGHPAQHAYDLIFERWTYIIVSETGRKVNRRTRISEK